MLFTVNICAFFVCTIQFQFFIQCIEIASPPMHMHYSLFSIQYIANMAEHNPAMSDLRTNEYITVNTGNSSGNTG